MVAPPSKDEAPSSEGGPGAAHGSCSTPAASDAHYPPPCQSDNTDDAALRVSMAFLKPPKELGPVPVAAAAACTEGVTPVGEMEAACGGGPAARRPHTSPEAPVSPPATHQDTPRPSTPPSRKRPLPYLESRPTAAATAGHDQPSAPTPALGPSPAKAPRVVCLTPQRLITPQVKVFQAWQGQPILLLPASTTAAAARPPWTPQLLLQDRDRLRRENQELHNHISLFQQLFRDKDKLKSVLKRLGIEAV